MVVQDIPFDKTETRTFIPDALKDVDNPPVFILKACTRRERSMVERLTIEENLRRYSDADFRAEQLRALDTLYAGDGAVISDASNRLKAFWEDMDGFVEEHEEAQKLEANYEWPAFEHPDQSHVDTLIKAITGAWRPLREMAACNYRFEQEQPLIIASVAIESWSGLDIKPVKTAGSFSIDLLADVKDALIGTYGDVMGLTAWLQLTNACIDRLYLNKVTEKNSVSPPPSTPPPAVSTGDGSASATTDGKSPASASSTKTPKPS